VKFESCTAFHWCLHYEIKGYPIPDRLWFFNNELLLNSDGIADIYEHPLKGTMYLHDETKNSNWYEIYLGCLNIETNSLNREGIYTLVVSNVHGSSNRSLDVKFHNQGPNISTNTAEKNKNMDQSEYITFWVYCTLIVLLQYYN